MTEKLYGGWKDPMPKNKRYTSKMIQSKKTEKEGWKGGRKKGRGMKKKEES